MPESLWWDSVALGIVSLFPHLLGSRSPKFVFRDNSALTKFKQTKVTYSNANCLVFLFVCFSSFFCLLCFKLIIILLVPKPETDSREKRHTLVCGFHGSQQQKSEPLQLHLPDCSIRASNQLGLLMQQDDQLLMLGSGTSRAERLTVVTSEEGETKNANAFGCVSGMVSDFVASYGKNFCLCLSLCVSLAVCLSVCLSVSPPLTHSLAALLSVCRPLHLFVLLSLSL